MLPYRRNHISAHGTLASVNHTTSTSPADGWTTQTLLDWIEQHLHENGVDEPTLVARWLVASVIGTDPIHLFTDLNRPASMDERDALRHLVARAARHEPVQYLLGEAGFLGRIFEVGPGVLIPRTATEGIVQHVLTWYRGMDPVDRPEPLYIGDIGTGSGAIAVTIACHIESAQVTAVDVSSDAVGCAEGNVRRHNLSDRIDVIQGDLCQPLGDAGDGGRYHAIVSNPPYLSDDRWAAALPNVREHEPAMALRGGQDGLDVIRRLLDAGPDHLHQGGLLMIEVDDCHAEEACRLAQACALLEHARILRDEFGDDRFIVCSRR